jgi:hypothetical protein
MLARPSINLLDWTELDWKLVSYVLEVSSHKSEVGAGGYQSRELRCIARHHYLAITSVDIEA